jgi:glycerol-3-phosphate acyltransferase PlsY
MILSLAIIALISYFIGSFPTAYLITKKLVGKDVRKIGSGNIGALNALRVIKGEKSAKLAIIGFILVLIIDMGKGALAVFSFQQLFSYPLSIALTLAAFFVVLGHNYSIFFKFKAGGRGAACLMGILLYLDFFSLLVWGLPIIFLSILTQLILEKKGLEKKINWQKFSEIFSILGTQITGRMTGLILALIPLYFYNPQIFLPIAAGTVLLLIKNVPRFEEYFKNLKSSSTVE